MRPVVRKLVLVGLAVLMVGCSGAQSAKQAGPVVAAAGQTGVQAGSNVGEYTDHAGHDAAATGQAGAGAQTGAQAGTQGGTQAAPATQPPKPADPGAQPAPAPAQEVQKLTITLKDFAFDPNVINLKKGVPVEITLINQGHRNHDFTVQGDWSFHSDVVNSGDTKVLTFTPDVAGTFQLFCSQIGHKSNGMVATVIVSG